jgi:hypothetical protein
MARVSLSIIFLFVASSTYAFAPNAQKSFGVATELNAINRRDAVGLTFAGLVAGLAPEIANAVNPALETFKGGKKTKGSFIPGKGLREQESFEEIQMVNDSNYNFGTILATNPALETFKGRKRTSGSFVPGKGYV